MKKKLMRIATMAVMMLAAISMVEAQEAVEDRGGTRFSANPCLPAHHNMEGHQSAWCYLDQITSLMAGWNWWSTCIEVTLDELKAALVDAVPGTAITITSQNNGSTTYNGSIWRGTLNTLDVTQMYKIKTISNCQIELTGMPLNPAEHPITIHNGTNWIGFPLNVNKSLNNAFAGFAVSGDLVRSKDKSASYTNQWRGTLNTLVPGQGYIYKSSTSTDRVLTFPASAQ